MDTKHQIWQYWAGRLHTWGLSGIAAAFLEAAGPVRLLAAQVFYLGQPILQPWVAAPSYQALLSLFEDDQQAETFITILREGM